MVHKQIQFLVEPTGMIEQPYCIFPTTCYLTVFIVTIALLKFTLDVYELTSALGRFGFGGNSGRFTDNVVRTYFPSCNNYSVTIILLCNFCLTLNFGTHSVFHSFIE